MNITAQQARAKADKFLNNKANILLPEILTEIDELSTAGKLGTSVNLSDYETTVVEDIINKLESMGYYTQQSDSHSYDTRKILYIKW